MILAHVKWFSRYSYADPPLSLEEVVRQPNFLWLAALSVGVIALFILLEGQGQRIGWIKRFDQWVSSKAGYAMGVMRIGTGASLIWSWQAGTLLAPELASRHEWAIWMQFIVAFLLVFKRTLPLAGLGILALYGLAVAEFGAFHMLDYLLYIGVGYYFIAGNAKSEGIRISALPAIYATVGFCLFWLGIEKMVFPAWSKFLLQEQPVLALGFDHDFFVLAAAFIEISLGFMIMICVQQRFLGIFITLLFFLTTLVFGREEVVGHTLIHAVLIVFIIAGPGKATPPLHWLPKVSQRAFASAVAFLAFIPAFMFPYTFGAHLAHDTDHVVAEDAHAATTVIEVPRDDAPELAIAIHDDPLKGWNLELVTENFRFAPGAASMEPVPGEGHAHLMIDGKKVARLYSHWYHIASLPPGTHEIMVTLNGNNHATLSVKGEPVMATSSINVLEQK